MKLLNLNNLTNSYPFPCIKPVIKMQLGQENWSDQFVEAMNVNGGDIENATAMDYVMHFLSFGFKTIFAIIPPPNLLGGWPCFFGALAFIAVFTLIISDLGKCLKFRIIKGVTD